MPSLNSSARGPALARTALLALCLLAAAGCGGPTAERYIPGPEDAQAAVEAALHAWQAGTPPGPVPDTAPVVHVTDSFRRPGETLHEFRILGEAPGDTPRCYAVELQFSPPREEKAQFVVVGIDPLWVFRLEDYQLLAHWEHRMDDGESSTAAGGTAAPPGGEFLDPGAGQEQYAMNEPPPDGQPAEAPRDPESPADAPRGAWWWLRVAEVRLRFVVLVLAALLVVTQWNRLRGVWDDWWHALQGAAAPAPVSADLEYFCPMDPGVVSVWPAVCPICNMDLVQRKKHDAQLLPEGVVARMQFSPYRVQLGGIRTALVERRPLDYELVLSGVLRHHARHDDEDAAQPGGTGSEQAAALLFEAAVSRKDVRLFAQTRDAQVFEPGFDARPARGAAELISSHGARTSRKSEAPQVRVTLAKDASRRFTAGTSVRAIVRVPAAELLAAASEPAGETAGGALALEAADDAGAVSIPEGTDSTAPSPGLLSVPESAVVDHGRRRFVFVESMPGTFDAVEVSLGPACGDHYPVVGGLQAGQRVAVAGAFLIDAESRLSSSQAVSYFGANQTAIERRQPQVRLAAPAGAARAPRLSPEEQVLAAKQGKCPVTGLSLDAMGGPVPILIAGRKIFVCCQGCDAPLQGDPEKYLSKLNRSGVSPDD